MTVDRAFILDRCKSLVDFQLWPPDMDGRIEPWLSNFASDESETALHLMNSLLYFSEPLVQQLFLAAFHNLSAIGRPKSASRQTATSIWRHFFDTLIVTRVTGETPSPADSGYIFARLARDKLGISESQIVEPEIAIQQLVTISNRPVLFVDDFVGSGQQFITTWNRQYPIGAGASTSFYQLARYRNKGSFFYCPAICTEYGADKIKTFCPEVVLSPGNFLANEYSCFSQHSLVWPRNSSQVHVAALEKASRRAGIPEDGGADDWRGFCGLGLCIALHYKTPDATIPLLYWDQHNWQPLVRHP